VPDKAVSVPIVAAELPPAKAEAATAAGPAPFRIEGAIEGEQMKIIRKSGGFEARPQGMAQFPTGKWSGNSQLLVKPRQQGEWVDLELPVAAEGTYRIVAYLTRAPDYGIIQFSLAGKPLGQPIDGFHSAGVASAEAVDLGTVKLKQGSATLRVETVDRNEKSVGVRYAWGLDCLVLTPAPDSPAPDEPDPIKDSLEEAKATFQSELEKLRSQLLENLDKAEEKARQSGNKKLVDQIKAERAVFEKEGKLPRAVATSDYQQKKSKARATLVAAYLSAVTAYSRAKMDARAEAVESERKRFEQDLPLDAFQPGSVWRGKTDITVIGTTEKHSTAATLIVLERNGSSFKARFEDGTAIREIRGTIDKGAIGWRATNVTAIQGGQGHNTGGKLRGTAIVLGAEWIRPKDKKGVVAVTKLQLENR
jgi:hypothetical protein